MRFIGFLHIVLFCSPTTRAGAPGFAARGRKPGFSQAVTAVNVPPHSPSVKRITNTDSKDYILQAVVGDNLCA
jgi:hypothetical protein